LGFLGDRARMAGFQIKVRNLETDEALVATLDSYEDALTFLSDRPHMMEIITVLSDVSPKQMSELKEAMRAYDADEKAKMAGRAGLLAEELRKAREHEEAMAAAEEARAREAAKSADPARPMKVKWSIEEGCTSNDAFDPRPVSAVVEQAVIAWVQERNGWVAERGQIVGEAEVEVYPLDVPEGGERIVRGGTFVPRLRPEEA
jgi:hypothetical protein